MREEPLYFEDVHEGDTVPEWSRKTDFTNWNRFAAVNDEFVPLHMDDEAARAAGQPGAFGMGNLRFTYLHNMLRDWIGIHGDIKVVSVQHRGMNFKNDVLTCKGKILKKYEKDGQCLLDLEVWVENQKGERVSPGTATVALPSKTKDRHDP
jgi:acyl dehydratase